MKNTVLVPSAIMIDGLEISRLMQTLNTINSIYLRIPEASIILIECSTTSLDSYIREILKKYGVTIIEMCEHSRVQEIKDKSKSYKNRAGFIKNLTEIYAINHVINTYDFSEFDRVCKLSGRYAIGPDFNWNLNKESFTTSVDYISPRYENMFAKQCTYWSMPVSMLNDGKTMFRLIEKWLINAWEKGVEFDIEHGLWVFLEKLNLPKNEVHPLGVIGLTDGKTLNMH